MSGSIQATDSSWAQQALSWVEQAGASAASDAAAIASAGVQWAEDAGDALVHDAGELVEDGAGWIRGMGNAAAAQAAGLAATGASWIEGSAEDIAAWLHGEDEDAEPVPQPEQAPVPVEEPAPDPSVEVPYLDQRDNDTEYAPGAAEGTSGDTQCTPTSTAMALLGLLGEQGFRDRAQALFAAKCGAPHEPAWYQQATPEHIVWEYIYAFSEKEWLERTKMPKFTKPVHQYGRVVTAVIEDFTNAGSGHYDESAFAQDQSHNCRRSLEAIPTLPAVVGTRLTSGHTVLLVDRLADGILVNDPFGARGDKGYLRNGATGEAPPAHRWQHNPELNAANPAVEARDDWGCKNFFTWDEVTRWSIGKWTASAGDADPQAQVA